MIEWDYRHDVELICPYCGKPQCEPWEKFQADEYSEVVCESCEQEFSASVKITFAYSSAKKPFPNNTAGKE